MGKRTAAEVLLLDKVLTAEEAVKCGFANSIIAELQEEPEWLDITKVPAITKLLATDYTTLVNCKRLMNAAKDSKKLKETIDVEGHGLLNSWLDEEFPPKLLNYMMSLKSAKPKL